MSEKFTLTPFSRRRFLAGTATAALASALPRSLLAAPPPAPKAAKFHRLNLSDPKAKPALESYKKAISAMLALPATDPRNWYRNSFIHLLDCPHGNWWFVVWHRGYLGWFEQTCRQLSGDPSFALPYWDWTAEPRVPASFFDGVLNPANPAYIASFSAFKSKLTAPMNTFWSSLTAAQVAQLKLRGFNSVADFWSQVPGMFFPPNQARGLTQANPNFDAVTKKAVSLPTITAALAPKTFLGFGSAKAAFHSQGTGSGILEGQPHNNVHNNVNGFMGDFLSPVDPIFFMHHANIDRLWDVWTRKQQGLGLPTLPTGADLTAWSKEPFLFFIDSAGKPVTQNKAGDYATIGPFNYDYQPGSGETVIKKSPAKAAAPLSGKSFAAAVKSTALAFSQRATGTVKVPPDLMQAASQDDGPTLFAQITIQPPADPRNVRFEVLVNAPAGTANVDPGSPHFAGSFEFFGSHHHFAGPFTFTVALSPALKAMGGANLLKSNEPLQIHVVPKAKGPGAQALKASLQQVVVGTF